MWRQSCIGPDFSVPASISQRELFEVSLYQELWPDVFLEDRRRVDGERGAGFVARQRLNGIEIKKVHNFEIDVSKLWTLYRVLKDANLIRGKECII